MASTVYTEGDALLMQEIVSAPAFQALSRVDKYAWPEIAVVLGSYATFALSTYLYLAGIFPYWLTFLLSGVALYAVFTPLHDSTHRSASSSPFVNELIGNVSAFLLVPGFTAALYRYLHLEHHRRTGELTTDPDEVFVSGWWPVRAIVWCCPDIQWIIWYFKRRHLRPAGERRVYWAGLGFSAIWHTAWLTSPYAWEFFLLWMLPQRLGLGLVVYLFAYIQHPDGIEQKDNPFQATRLIKGGLMSRILMLGQSQHLMHHLFPSVPFYRYYKAWANGGNVVADYGIAWQWPFTGMNMPGPRSQASPRIFDAKVVDAYASTDEVMSYLLEPVASESFPLAEPGSHIDIHLGEGCVRQYSLCGDPADPHRYKIAVKREANGRGGSQRVHDTIRLGDVVQIGSPRNLFPLSLSGRRYTLVAGGIGVTPLIAMAYALTAESKEFQLHLCARSLDSVPLRGELEQSVFAANVRLHLDDGGDEQKLSADSLPAWKPGDLLYLCGPEPFMQWVKELAAQRGWPASAVHTESFAAPDQTAAENKPFDLILARSGRTVHVPENRSALEVLQENKVAIVASCTRGLCGACVCGVVSGEVDHRDHYLNDFEKQAHNKMAMCVSRASGESLVVDL